MERWQYKVRDLIENRNTRNSFEATATEMGFEVDDAEATAPIRVEAVLFRTEQNVFVDLQIETEFRLECRMCLVPFDQPVQAEFSARYEYTNRPDQLDDPLVEFGLRYYIGDYLDIADDIRGTLVLEVPQWPSCSEDCAGLCRVCGKNRNADPCDCDESSLKPNKLSGLASLLDK